MYISRGGNPSITIMVLLELCGERRKKLCGSMRMRGENEHSFAMEALHPLIYWGWG
jgi:hypothetical protein